MMIKDIKIKGYRCFKDFEATDLSRINLIVGKNNAGKTSFLEAVDVVYGEGSPLPFFSSCLRRGEIIESNDPYKHNSSFQSIENIIHNRLEGRFNSCLIESGNLRVTAEIEKQQLDLFESNTIHHEQNSFFISPPRKDLTDRYFVVRNSNEKKPFKIPISSLSEHYLFSIRGALRGSNSTHLIGKFAKDEPNLGNLWDNISLTDKEKDVVDALSIVEPDIERITHVNPDSYNSNFNGFLIRLKSSSQRIPIGSLGDGVKQLLYLSLHMVSSENSALLIDEIDTGLHYSVLKQTWKLISNLSKKLNIQIFATTHSHDCLSALAKVCEENDEMSNDVSVHRIQKNRDKPISYSGRELLQAIKNDMEVR